MTENIVNSNEMCLLEKIKKISEVVDEIKSNESVKMFLNRTFVYFQYKEDIKYKASIGEVKIDQKNNLIGIFFNLYSIKDLSIESIIGMIFHEIGHTISEKNIFTENIFDEIKNRKDKESFERENYKIGEVLADAAGAVLAKKINPEYANYIEKAILECYDVDEEKREVTKFDKNRIEFLKEKKFFYLFE